jgi:hypothetical protein
MSYIGRNIDSINNISTLDNLSFNGSDATFNLTQNSVAFVPVSADALQIQIDGVIQSGNYTVSGSTVTFDFTPSGSSVCNGIRHFGVGLLTTVSDSSITTAKLGADSVNGTKIADNSISDEHLDITAITGQTAITSLADTDKFLVSDASDSGNLKYVEKQYLPSGSLTETGSLYSDNSTSGNEMIIDNCFSNDYNFYLINFYCLPENNEAGLTMRYREGGGSPATESASNYYYGSRYFDSSGGLGSNTGASQNKIVLTDKVSYNEEHGGIHGFFTIRLNRDNSNACTFTANGKYSLTHSASSSRNRNYYHGSSFNRANSTHAIAGGFTLYWETGNTKQFNIKVYGYNGSAS